MENKIKYVDEVMWENSTNMWIKLLYGIIKICKWGYHREKKTNMWFKLWEGVIQKHVCRWGFNSE